MHREQTYLEIDEASELLIAAEMVAAARGWPHGSLPVGLLDNAFAKNREEFLSLSDLAVQAVKRLLIGKNELLEAGRTEAVQEAIESSIRNLGERLVREFDPVALQESAAKVRVKPRSGDVFAIPLGTATVSYARLYQKDYFYVYSGIFDISAPPPIGSRDFMFYTTSVGTLRRLIGTDVCKIVGRDPLGKHEIQCPAIYRKAARTPVILSFAGPFREPRPVAAFQCVGMECFSDDDLESLQERILKDETSVKRSLKNFAEYLSTSEIDKALELLNGRTCRRFDAEENRAFEIEV